MLPHIFGNNLTGHSWEMNTQKNLGTKFGFQIASNGIKLPLPSETTVTRKKRDPIVETRVKNISPKIIFFLVNVHNLSSNICSMFSHQGTTSLHSEARLYTRPEKDNALALFNTESPVPSIHVLLLHLYTSLRKKKKSLL